MHAYRSHTCGELRKAHVGQTVKLSGWLHRRREHPNAIFIDLRDHYGITQVVVYPNSEFFETAKRASAESVLTVVGAVIARENDAVNPELATGEVELPATSFHVESVAEKLPLPVFGEPDYPEEVRLTNRFLDLRRETLHKNMVLRSAVIASIRRRMIAEGFTEFQTPILTASSPEGARDFLVPSRIHPGEFYALPQAPQQFKQLLMVSGFDRYFQIAPCFRDEDGRADRSPGEFYQLDLEMSFVTQEDVFNTVEPVIRGVFEEFCNWDGKQRAIQPGPFVHIPYAEAMLKYGVDKPDLRNPIICSDVTAFFARPEVEFKAFKGVIDKGGIVRAIPAPNAASQPRSFFDKMNAWAQKDMQAPGLGYVVFEDDGGKLTGKGPIAKFLPENVIAEMAKHAGIKSGDALFFAAGDKTSAVKLQGQARIRVGEELGLIEQNIFKFCWIVDFPMYEWDEDNKKVDFSHNPFSMPQGGMETLMAADTVEKQIAIKAFQYDIVCNGVELSSGAIRNHRPDVMLKAFELAGYGPDVVEAKFGGMLNAFRYGAPPHGGIAPGIDRMVMLIAETESIRDVILFPMNQQARDLLMGAPSPVEEKQLKELNLRINPVVKA